MAEVGIAQLRHALKDWIDRAKSGDDVIVTERGRPVLRISRIDATPLVDRLTAAGRISRPSASARASAKHVERVEANAPVASLIVDERDRGR